MFQAQLGRTNRESEASLEHPLVAAHNFIMATRETGYRSVATAIAELIDNAIQAKATNVQVFVLNKSLGDTDNKAESQITIAVLDDGEGMDRATLWTALQFGGSGRFDDRSS